MRFQFTIDARRKGGIGVIRTFTVERTGADQDATTRQAIVTSYRGPTDSRGSRVIARCEAKRISVPWDHALDVSANHAAAALQLMDQLGWSERNSLAMGGTKDGYVFVQLPKGGE